LAKAQRSVVRKEHAGTVLLVDDDPFVLQYLARSVHSSLLRIVTCQTPHEALNYVLSEGVVAVVSDISMPEMSGLELLRIIRQHDPELPVVLVTGVPCIRSAAEAVEHGAFMYLVKPVDPAMLTMTLERAVRQYCSTKVKRDSLIALGVDGKTADLARLQSQYERALKASWIAYQPIVRSTDGSVFGHEALLRCDESLLRDPELIVNAAERLNDLPRLGRLVRELAAKTLLDSQDDRTLFINLHPCDLRDPDLSDADSILASVADRVVLEITERASMQDIGGFRLKISELRELGFRIAVDDVGAGYAGLNCIAMLEPEFIKLDMTLVRNLDEQPIKQKLVASLVALGKDVGHTVIAEGVESLAERDTLVELGCDLLQGYFISHPSRIAPPVNWPPFSQK